MAQVRNVPSRLQALVGDAQFGPGIAFEQVVPGIDYSVVRYVHSERGLTIGFVRTESLAQDCVAVLDSLAEEIEEGSCLVPRLQALIGTVRATEAG